MTDKMNTACAIWSIGLDVESEKFAFDAMLTLMSFIVDAMESGSIEKDDPPKATAFLNNFPTYSGMLFSVINALQDSSKRLSDIAESAYNLSQNMRTKEATENK